MIALQWSETDKKAVATAKALAADAVEKVGSGHPGTPISLAPIAYSLFQNIMRHDPADPHWLGRDRFILSSGHASLLLYVQLYLSGYGLKLEDLEALRTWGSLTPGHPEYRHTAGVEMTTGPLGQGLATAVGMAMAARRERGLFDPDAPAGSSIFDHFIYVVAGDGCLQEGITSEACSLAGTQDLGNLLLIYDANRISIEGHTAVSFSEDVLARYRAYGWQTLEVDWTHAGKNGEYAEDVQAFADAIEQAKAETHKPTIIKLDTVIGWPTPGKQDTGGIHGSKLGSEALAGLKKALGLDPEKSFDVDPAVLAHTREVAKRGAEAHEAWKVREQAWRAANPQRAALLDRLSAGTLPAAWTDVLPVFEAGGSMSTRTASGKVLSALAPVLPELWGGSADLAGSNDTTMSGEPSFLPVRGQAGDWTGDPYGRTLHFGVREHAMGAIINGMVLHGPTRAYGGTFFTFADYMRGSVRLAALMRIPSVFVWTHDSIGVGEDGPTHQPVEHLTAYRAIPNLAIVRPADANETTWAWRSILERNAGPTGLVLTRQNVPIFDRVGGHLGDASGMAKGAYVLAEAEGGRPDVLLMASGSEVQFALGAREILASEGVRARVVSVPCLEWFAEQDEAYRESVLPKAVKARVSVEAGLAVDWRPLVGDRGRSVSLEHFGASAEAGLLFTEFGFTAQNVADKARESLADVRENA